MGLGRASKAKKQKKEKSPVKEVEDDTDTEDFLTVPLEVGADADDPLSQLSALWKTWLLSDRENELILNGVVNECDRLMRLAAEGGKEKDGETNVKRSPELYAIFGLALADSARFHTEDDENSGTAVKDYFDNAMGRVDNGLDKFGESGLLKFAKSSILMNRIPLEYISHMSFESKSNEYPDVTELLDDALELYREGSKDENVKLGQELWIFEILEAFNDLQEIVRNFGRDQSEEIDSEEEVEEEEMEESGQIVSLLDEHHPLYKLIGKLEKPDYGEFFKDQVSNYLKHTENNKQLKRKVAGKLGLWYLSKAEQAATKYGSGGKAESMDAAIGIIKTCIKHLKEAWSDEDPDSWVDLAEAQITYANLLPVDSKEQEHLYELAEKSLKKANNATHGKYTDILESLHD
ncbi:hypothetical protein FOA43_004805 [Brettanomyces nanus]|uniref:Enhancer of translation termination 1 n=1 Tax=Eeniella nana TaxID=13502 RepID=A0A875SCL3_EENNA|nr:uncharacterized protein FOA43_004805 [Brettanomyces nanus]QPG77392.1 hypothetical protein FOA43_004805 [Brettanomyces nanus]